MKLEQNGPETCRVLSDRGFVLIRMPVKVLGERDDAPVTFLYTIGGFVGRESPWPRGEASETVLAFRIPRELFRDRERFTVQVLRTDERGASRTLWTSRRQVRWAKDSPMLESLPDAAPGESD